MALTLAGQVRPEHGEHALLDLIQGPPQRAPGSERVPTSTESHCDLADVEAGSCTQPDIDVVPLLLHENGGCIGAVGADDEAREPGVADGRETRCL